MTHPRDYAPGGRKRKPLLVSLSCAALLDSINLAHSIATHLLKKGIR